jgi:hypothetical protein
MKKRIAMLLMIMTVSLQAFAGNGVERDVIDFGLNSSLPWTVREALIRAIDQARPIYKDFAGMIGPILTVQSVTAREEVLELDSAAVTYTVTLNYIDYMGEGIEQKPIVIVLDRLVNMGAGDSVDVRSVEFPDY